MAVTSSDRALIEAIAAMGWEVSPRGIREYRERDLIAAGGKGGRGKTAEYPPGTAQLICAYEAARASSPGSFQRRVLTAWWNGAEVPDRALRRAFAAQFAETLAKSHDASLGERTRGSDHLGDVLPRTSKRERSQIVRDLGKAAVGEYNDLTGFRTHMLADAIKPHVSAALELVAGEESLVARDSAGKSLELLESGEGTKAMRELLGALNFAAGAVAARRAQRVDLDQARDQFRELAARLPLSEDNPGWYFALITAVWLSTITTFQQPPAAISRAVRRQPSM